MAKCLVLGALGFVGNHLVRELLTNGYEVTVFDRVVGQDLSDSESLEQNIASHDEIVLLAALADLTYCRVHPQETFNINIKGVWDTAILCAKYKKRLLFASTVCTYGPQDFDKFPETNEDVPLNAWEIYGVSKVIGEGILKMLNFSNGLSYVAMRLPTMTGEPMQREELGVKIFFRQAMANRPIQVHGDGSQRRTITHVGDVVKGIVKIIEHPEVKNMAINLSSEESVSALEMAEKIKELTGSVSEIVHIEQRPGQTFEERIVSHRAKELLGWEPTLSFTESMQQVYEFLKRKEGRESS